MPQQLRSSESAFWGEHHYYYSSETLESVIIQWDPRYINQNIPLPLIPDTFTGPDHWARCYLPYIVEEQRAHIARALDGSNAMRSAWWPLQDPYADVEDWDDVYRSWTCNVKFDLPTAKEGVDQIKRKDVVILTNDPSPRGIWALGVVRGMPNAAEAYPGWCKPKQRAPYDVAVFAPYGSRLAEALRTTTFPDAQKDSWWIAYVGSTAPYTRVYDALQAWLEPGLQPSPLMDLLLGFEQRPPASEEEQDIAPADAAAADGTKRAGDGEVGCKAAQQWCQVLEEWDGSHACSASSQEAAANEDHRRGPPPPGANGGAADATASEAGTSGLDSEFEAAFKTAVQAYYSNTLRLAYSEAVFQAALSHMQQAQGAERFPPEMQGSPAADAAFRRASSADSRATSADVLLLRRLCPRKFTVGDNGYGYSGRGGGLAASGSGGVVCEAQGTPARTASLVGLLSVLRSLSPPDRTTLVCSHSNQRVVDLAAGFLPLLQKPKLQFLGSGELQRGGLRPMGPALRMGDCVVVLASSTKAHTTDINRLNLATRAARLSVALHGGEGWFGTLQQLHRLLGAAEAELLEWSRRSAADSISSPSKGSRRSSGASGLAATAASCKEGGAAFGGSGDEGHGGPAADVVAGVGCYVKDQLKLLIGRLRHQGEVLLADLPSVAWATDDARDPDQQPTPDSTTYSSWMDTASDATVATGMPTQYGSSNGIGCDGDVTEPGGIRMVHKALEAAAAVEYELGFLSAAEVQAVLLRPQVGAATQPVEPGRDAAAVGGSSSGGSGANEQPHRLVGAMCRLLAALGSCMDLPRCRLRNSEQALTRSKLVTALATIWGPDGWMHVVPELRRLVRSPTYDTPPPQHRIDSLAQASASGMASSAGFSSGQECATADPDATGVRVRLLKLLTRFPELAAALNDSVPVRAWVGMVPGVAVGASETARQGQAILADLASACKDTTDSLDHLDEVEVLEALHLQQQQEQQQQRGGEGAWQQSQRLHPLSRRERPLILKLADPAPTATRLRELPRRPLLPPSLAAGVTAASAAGALSPLVEAFKYNLNKVLEALVRMEAALDVRSVVCVDALRTFCLDHARVLFSTASGLGKKELQRAQLDVDVCLMDEATRMQAVDLAPLMQQDYCGRPGVSTRAPGLSSPRLLLLVGDPQGAGARPQVLSSWAWHNSYGWSIYEQLQQRGWREWGLVCAGAAHTAPAAGAAGTAAVGCPQAHRTPFSMEEEAWPAPAPAGATSTPIVACPQPTQSVNPGAGASWAAVAAVKAKPLPNGLGATYRRH